LNFHLPLSDGFTGIIPHSFFYHYNPKVYFQYNKYNISHKITPRHRVKSRNTELTNQTQAVLYRILPSIFGFTSDTNFAADSAVVVDARLTGAVGTSAVAAVATNWRSIGFRVQA